MKRVTGLGGVFVKCKNKEAMVKWYTQHLGINMQDWGVVFMPKEFTKNHPGGYQVFSLNNESSNYFEPSTAPFMLNFTVADLASLLPVLKLEGVQIVKETELSEYGKFAWVLDPDGNKVELWEPPLQLPH